MSENMTEAEAEAAYMEATMAWFDLKPYTGNPNRLELRNARIVADNAAQVWQRIARENPKRWEDYVQTHVARANDPEALRMINNDCRNYADR